MAADLCGPRAVFLSACLHGNAPAATCEKMMSAVRKFLAGAAKDPALSEVQRKQAQRLLPEFYLALEDKGMLPDDAFDVFADFLGRPFIVLTGTHEQSAYVVSATIYAGLGKTLSFKDLLTRPASDFHWIWHLGLHYELALPVGELKFAQEKSLLDSSTFLVVTDVDTSAARNALPGPKGEVVDAMEMLVVMQCCDMCIYLGYARSTLQGAIQV